MVSSSLCSLVEHQSLVDIAIRCGNSTVHAHKCVLAANSGYFREHLEKNSGVEQIVVNGLDFAVVKALVEFMYCGETNIAEENFKFFIAAAKMFEIRGVQALAADNHYQIDETLQIPHPLFLTKKPKYSSTYFPMNNVNVNQSSSNPDKITTIPSDSTNFHRKLKRKYMKSEAEKACAKEAAASRLALEALQKELATTNQLSSFVIEDSCSETTVENFIPHSEEPYIDNLNHLQAVPLEVVNYADLNQSVLNQSVLNQSVLNQSVLNQSVLNPVLNLTNQVLTKPINVLGNPVLQYDNVNSPRLQEAITDKLRQIFGGNVPTNVEIMFKTNDGSFMNVTDEVLQNITKDSLQYQVIDEHGRAGEVQELTVNTKDSNFTHIPEVEEDPIAKYVNPIETITDNNQSIKEIKIDDINSDQSILEAIIENEKRENELKFVSVNDLNEIETLEKLKKDKQQQSTMDFCDEFLNSTLMGDNFLNNITINNVQDDNGDEMLKKIREDNDLSQFSDKEIESVRLDEDGKLDDIDEDKFDLRNKRMFTRKKK
nr:uncharacterized protein LOC111420426 [Onthophagus taurus]